MLNGLLEPEIDVSLQLQNVCNRLNAFCTSLRLLIELKPEKLHKKLHNFHFHKNIDISVSEAYALEIYDISVPRLPIFLAEFGALSGANLQLKLLHVPVRFTTILNANGNVAGRIEMSGNMPFNAFA